MSMIQEFKAFAMRGNVVDLAVGVVIGGAFGAIVTSLVGDLIMPVVGVLTPGGGDLAKAAIVLKEGVAASADGVIKAVPPTLFAYGKFLQTILNFVIVAFSIFILVKGINATKKKEEAAAPAGPTPQEALLAEIRDLLKKQAG